MSKAAMAVTKTEDNAISFLRFMSLSFLTLIYSSEWIRWTAHPMDTQQLPFEASPVAFKGTWWISVILALALATESCYKSIRVSSGVHEKSDNFSTVVDAVDYGGADPLRIIDRLEVSIIEDESVGESGSVYIRSNHVVLIVNAECLGEGGRPEIESGELPIVEQKTVVDPSAVDVKARDRSLAIDACGLGGARGCRDRDHQKHSPVIVENVGVIDACGIGEIAGSLVMVI